MRITEFLTNSSFTRQIHKNRSEMVKYNEQISSGKKVTRASDDTVAFLTGKLFEAQVKKNEQYQNNVNTGLSRSRRVQDTLDQMNDLLISAKTLATAAGNDTNNETERKNIASQMASLKEELVELANSDFSDVYLFGGTQTTRPPFTPDQTAAGGVATDSNTESLKVLIGDGNVIDTTVSGQELRQTEAGDLFGIIQNSIDALDAGDGDGIRDSIDDLDKAVKHTTSLSTTVANNINRLEFAHERLEESIIGEKGEVSRYTEADVIESMLNFSNAQTAYESVLASQSMIMQTSLLDFLR